MIIKGNPNAASKVRVDGKCGASFPLADGSPAECNVASNDYCCSEWGGQSTAEQSRVEKSRVE
mgnify:CR=1 FL=1